MENITEIIDIEALFTANFKSYSVKELEDLLGQCNNTLANMRAIDTKLIAIVDKISLELENRK